MVLVAIYPTPSKNGVTCNYFLFLNLYIVNKCLKIIMVLCDKGYKHIDYLHGGRVGHSDGHNHD